MCKNFIDDISSIFDIFGDITLSEMAEKIIKDVKEGNSFSTYKSETWKNGECVNRIEKEWEDGKLVHSEGESCKPECVNCKKDDITCGERKCKCENKENNCNCENVYATNNKLQKTIEKLRTENAELNKSKHYLEETFSDMSERVMKLAEENKELKEKINKIKNLFE